MLEEDAIISMVDANLQRERISPSEKAFAYKMKYDVLKRKAGRRKCSQVDYLTGKECGGHKRRMWGQSQAGTEIFKTYQTDSRAA